MTRNAESPSPTRVLVVDDNRDAGDTTALMRLAGYHTRACSGGPTALAEAAVFRRGCACST